jgi:hypothetical protein
LIGKADQPEQACNCDNRIFHRRDCGALPQELQHDTPLCRAPGSAALQQITAMQYNLLHCKKANPMKTRVLRQRPEGGLVSRRRNETGRSGDGR